VKNEGLPVPATNSSFWEKQNVKDALEPVMDAIRKGKTTFKKNQTQTDNTSDKTKRRKKAVKHRDTIRSLRRTWRTKVKGRLMEKKWSL